MADSIHPAATHHLPSFITPPGKMDVLMVVMGVILGLSVLMFGILYLRLHALPEHIAHRSQRLQFEIVCVLGLIAMFTHMHIFWIAGLLLAMIDLPDFGTPLNRIAASAEKVAGFRPGEDATRPAEAVPSPKAPEEPTEPRPDAATTQITGAPAAARLYPIEQLKKQT
jgi:hypothetical protein